MSNRKTNFAFPLLCALNILFFPVAFAQNQFSLGELQPGQLVLNLSATEQQSVAQDTLNASLMFSTQGRDKTTLQNDVNAAMRKALDLLEGSTGIEYNTTQYQVYMMDPAQPTRRDVNNPVWRAQQEVQMNSLDSASLLELVGQLQENGLVVTSLYYSLSTARYEEIADTLMVAALKKLQDRANSAAQALAMNEANLVEVSLDGSPNFTYKERFNVGVAMAADAAFTPPVADAGETQVSLTVSARAVLNP
ncbi:MAG: SIMPL domain-containing protein [Pseudomonadota bacterium]